MGTKILLGIIIGCCLVIGGCFACATLIWRNAQQDPTLKAALSNSSSADSSAKLKQPNESQWQYSEGEDKMSNQATHYATVVSSNTVNFGFPYNGEQHAILMLRKRRGSNDVILAIEKGQFLCGITGCSVSVRFDDKPVRQFSAAEASDHSTTKLFINNERLFIAEAKKAMTIRIQAVIYQNGSPVFEFDTSGLKW